MRYEISATQNTDGSIDAVMYDETGATVAEKAGFKTTNAVDRWARGAAKDHKKNNLPSAFKSLSYTHTFSL